MWDLIGCVWLNKTFFWGGGGSLFIKFGNHGDDDDACVGLCFIKPGDELEPIVFCGESRG